MKSNFFLLKRKKEKNNIDGVKKRKLSYIDKLFLRIFLSSILILTLIIIDHTKINKSTKIFKDNLNFLKIANIFNGNFGNFITPKIDEHAYVSNTYDEVFYDPETRVNTVYNYGFDGITNLENGIVTKIYHKQNGYYDITIKGYDGYNYTYCDLESIDYRIYSFVSNEAIIGVAPYDKNLKSYSFKLTIEKEGVYYDYYQNAKS